MNKLKLPIFQPDSVSTSAQATLVFGGDFCPIGKYEKKILEGKHIFDDKLQALFNDSFSIINLEAPLCDKNLKAYSQSGFGLRGEPEVANYLKKLGIDVAGLANNHTKDFDEEGIKQTIQCLDKAGILTAGAGQNLVEAEVPLEVNLNGLRIGIWILAEKELNLAGVKTAGSSWFEPSRNIAQIEGMKDRFDFLVIFLHAGHEFISTPSPRIREACRAFVDAGADAIIAHHPHVIQGVEKYKNALIAYSLGNLVFDSPYVDRFDNTDLGYLVRLDISKHTINEVEIIPYKLRPDTVVTSLDNNEFDMFFKDFQKLSGNITDDSKFLQEWENNVKFRWETEYEQVLNNFSSNFMDKANKDYAIRSRNLFASPTHAEIIEKIFFMLEEGKLTRST
jgi:poly-gamma-glutamate synthesis protein (capsule biosynthesis protein)